MKTILLFALCVHTLPLLANGSWKTVAVTIDCAQSVSVKAMEGSSFVMIGDQKLTSQSGENFSFKNMNSVTFENKHYLFRMPGMIESGVPKIEVKTGPAARRCNMKTLRK